MSEGSAFILGFINGVCAVLLFLRMAYLRRKSKHLTTAVVSKQTEEL